ncbi:hypothetical protein UR09_03680 [Candidatus Nitromaritima sp. SCGC AAA799-A02]|nr:hypothetical protein UR09_03680 [Candidatus Nitromaritima sp. SCGC AAA799-A02]
MASLNSWQGKVELFLRLLIAVDCLVMAVIFLHNQFGVEFFFPMPGNKLNNPLAGLLGALFLIGVINPRFRERWLGKLKNSLTSNPDRYYIFGVLILIEIFLQIMWRLYPENFLWNLNAEQGYGTHFSVVQLYVLGLFVLMIGMNKRRVVGSLKQSWPWYLVACIYFFIGLDDCIGIHENFIKWSQEIAPGANTFHFIHEWLWFYGPFMLFAAAFLMRFFWMEFRQNKGVLLIMFLALVMWLGVLVLEGVAKSHIDPFTLEGSRIGIAVEEGLEMFGATLFLFGFSLFQRLEKPQNH